MKLIKKKNFSFLEVLVVLLILLMIGGLMGQKGSSFVRNFIAKSQAQSLTDLLNKSYLYAQVTKKKVEVQLKASQPEGIILIIHDFSYKKQLSKLGIIDDQIILEFYPAAEPSHKLLTISSLRTLKKIKYDPEKSRFVLANL